MKTLILGLGNPLITDDSIGLRVAAEVKSRLANRIDVEVAEDFCGGLRLMERMEGYDRAIIVDAILSGAPAGTIHRLRPGDMPTQKSTSSHDVNLTTALALGRQAGLHLPREEDIALVAIEAVEVHTFSDQCTPDVAAALPGAVEEVLRALDEMDAAAG